MSLILQFWPVIVFSFVLAMLLIFFATKLFPKIGLMDRPQNYGLTRKPIPYYGGVPIYLAFSIALFVFLEPSPQLWGLFFGGTLLAVVGFIDDYRKLSPGFRIFAQFLAGFILVLFGVGISSFEVPFWGTVELNGFFWAGISVLSAVFTVFWVMALVNTMNFVDGVSGLSSGVGFFAGVTLFLLSVHPGLHFDPASQIAVAKIALIMAMVSLAFLIFDFPKSKILMGDTGSTFLGFLIAALAIYSGGKVATAFLVLGIPILDMIWVVVRRTLQGQKFWKGDRGHLHHRLLDVGFSDRKVVFLYLFVTAFLGFLAVSFVSGQQKFFVFLGLIVLMFVLGSALVLKKKSEV